MILKTFINPSESELLSAITRPQLNQIDLNETIKGIFNEVQINGDQALKKYSVQFDKVDLDVLKVSENEFQEAVSVLPNELKIAIQKAADNIKQFHASQIQLVEEIETTTGVFCWRKSVPIQKVGLYIPGGSAPLFSTVLMLGIPAQIANVPTKILCSPPNKLGKIHPAILFAAQLAGIKNVYKVGGAQAIAAMTLGTEQIPKVDKLFGPGNQYVTAAKQFAQNLGVAIDMPAGPSEVLVAADDSVSPRFIAADLLAQAEHGADSQVVFITDSKDLVEKVNDELLQQLEFLTRSNIAIEALSKSNALVVPSEKWSEIINSYAPEHLIVMGKYEDKIVNEVVNAGSVFIGKYTAESFGDYASGTNHTLPTNGYARSYSGVSLDSFVKKITFQRIEEKGLRNLGPTVVTLAKAEELDAHANAVNVRLETIDLETVEKSSFENISANLIRKDLQNVVPYSSARDEFSGVNKVFLDANENALIQDFNRYPDPFQKELKQEIARRKNLNAENLVLGNGSDEIIDLIFRLVGTPFKDKVAFLNPSYGMYSVSAKLNGLETIQINLNKDFSIKNEAILDEAKGAKILILCNPNNPTGKLISKENLIEICEKFSGLIVIDEAYIDFCLSESMATEIDRFPNLIILQTLSKAYGMAGLRVGMAICNSFWVKQLNAIKPPYNISSATQRLALQCLKSTNWDFIKEQIIVERDRVYHFLKNNENVDETFISYANFILFRIKNATEIYKKLVEKGIVVRNRSNQFNCEDTLRVSIGNKNENDAFISTLTDLLSN